MEILITALAFFVLLSVLILIHELGHYLAAKEAGVTVEEFGFGIPPRALTLFKRKGTHFTLNWIPFGGFVRLKGESAMNEGERRARGSFGAASIPARSVILLAGVAMNFLFALLIFVIGFSFGRWIPTYLSYEDMKEAAVRGEIHMIPSVYISGVLQGGPAAQAHVPALSLLTTVNGTPVDSPEQVSPLLAGKKLVQFTLLTGANFTEEKKVMVVVQDGKAGIEIRAYPRDLSAPARSLPGALSLSFREAGVVLVQTVVGLQQLVVSLFSHGTVPEGVTGIVGIAELTHLSLQEGFMTYLRLLALLSLSLAALNVLPLPALDGGRLLFVLIELVRRKPANVRFETTTNLIGFLVLIGLILIITYNDIIHLFL